MPTEENPARDPLASALDELRGEHPALPGEPVDRYWLRVGLRLALRQPGRGQLLLDRLEAAASGDGATAAPVEPPEAAASAALSTGEPDAAASDTAAGPGPDHDELPVQSMLLARSAAMPEVTDEAIDPETLFGWAARLTRDEVLWMGRIVGEMLAEGAPHNLTRGFGITWRDGARLPDLDFDALFHAFTELEITVSGVLAGYDLRTAPRSPRKRGVGGAVAALFSRGDGLSTEAGAVMEHGGEPAQRGLVALWNVWAAMRFRAAVPPELFEQLTRPWVTVIGRLPGA